MTKSSMHRLSGLIAAVFLPLASGALWSVLSLRLHAELPSLALLVAASLLLVREHFAPYPHWLGGVLASLCCALGLVYALWLKAAMVVTMALGVGFIDAIFMIGPDLSLAITRARLSGGALGMIFGAIALAYWIGFGARKPAPQK